MKLTKQLEAEILKLYNGYWDAYLKGDVEAMHPLLADEYTQVGSAESEVFSNKKDAVQFLYDTIDQVARKLEMRNRKTTLEQQEHAILIHEFCDLYALADGNWIFYSRFRASTIMQQKKEGWKITHQHSSFPDVKTEAGQNIAIDKIAAENLLLREAIKRRTIELEQKNRDLEIESALEKVRSRSMGMQKSEELKEVIKIVYQQLTHLKIKLDHAGFVVDYTAFGDWHFWIADAQDIPSKITHPYFESVWANQFNEAKEKGVDLFATNLNFEEKNKFYNELLSHVPGLPEVSRDFYLSCPGLAASTVLLDDVALYIENFSGYPYSDDENNTLMRFGKVFQQTYTRFLDLQKAEAQAREAQIEGALERVRSTSLAMHSSQDLSKVVYVVFTELVKLDAKLDRCLILTVNPQTLGITWYLSGKEGLLSNNGFLVPDNEHLSHQAYLHGWRTKRKKWHYLLGGEEKQLWDAYGFSQTGLAQLPEFIKVDMAAVEAINLTISSDDFGCLIASSFSPLSEAHTEIVERFSIVFNQTYTRFLDLQKAEAQAREAQVETALERVRSRSLAMYKSDELNEVVSVLFERLKDLHIPFTAVGIAISIEGSKDLNAFVCGENEAGLVITNYRLPYFDNKISNDFNKVLENKLDYFVGHYSKEEKDTFYTYLLEHTPEFRQLPENIKRIIFDSASYTVSMMAVNKATFNINDFEGKVLADDEVDIIRRFAKVFDQAYTRFLDLQKAEAQAREAQIEAALERVRARTMAMQKSTDLAETSALLFGQLSTLMPELWTSGFVLCDKNKSADEWWLSGGSGFMPDLMLPNVGDPLHHNIYQAWLKGESYYEEVIEGKPLQQHYEWLMTIPSAIAAFDALAAAGIKQPVWQQLSCAYFSKGYLVVITEKPCEESQLFKRFAQVFEQTYTRFLDLQKAEAQAKEARIEAALERVRSRSLAMHHSSELSHVVDTLLTEFTNLEFTLTFCIINLINEEDKSNMVWAANPETGHHPESYYMKFEDYPFHHAMWAAWKAQKKNFIYILAGEEKKNYDEYLYTETEFRRFPKHIQDANKALERYVAGFTFFKYSGLQTVSVNHISADELVILERFGRVFEQSYTRFLDLQKAEAQAREAQIETGLERVRSRSLAMHHTVELQEVIHTVHKELLHLNIAISGGSFIAINSDIQTALRCWGSGGTADTSEEVILPLYEKPFCSNLINGIKNGPGFFTEEYTRQEKVAFFTFLFKHEPWSNLDLKQQQETLSSEGGYTRSCCVSQHTSIFIINHFGKIFSEYENEILKRFAKVFEQAYTRFLDLQKAEAQAEIARQNLIQIQDEKQRAEAALLELRVTQKQLIQSEKMASLGELTAGIAHEIQNPLNFVNNFSDVSNELLDEMMDEMTKGNFEEVKEILNDVKQNLVKINHHGKRADAIVKGMLQHSRSSSGVKEPTDINALADEYLRLAYHGLRAKDKSFNATLITDFDASIGQIKIVPQDIGMVILNLITNAFYAAALPPPAGAGFSNPDYIHNPTIWVSTKKAGEKVEIKVRDNGPGIPQKILDKIFQPFFTTKPTGQGTGLGLSLSYDIVKAHGGEIKVETKEGKARPDDPVGRGSEFIILLPIV